MFIKNKKINKTPVKNVSHCQQVLTVKEKPYTATLQCTYVPQENVAFINKTELAYSKMCSKLR